MHDLWKRVNEIWEDEMPTEVCRNLIWSMLERMQAAIKAKRRQQPILIYANNNHGYASIFMARSNFAFLDKEIGWQWCSLSSIFIGAYID
jgi:hypothetical protein